MNFAVEPIMGAINTALNNGLTGMGGSSKIVLGLILGGMMEARSTKQHMYLVQRQSQQETMTSWQRL